MVLVPSLKFFGHQDRSSCLLYSTLSTASETYSYPLSKMSILRSAFGRSGVRSTFTFVPTISTLRHFSQPTATRRDEKRDGHTEGPNGYDKHRVEVDPKNASIDPKLTFEEPKVCRQDWNSVPRG